MQGWLERIIEALARPQGRRYEGDHRRYREVETTASEVAAEQEAMRLLLDRLDITASVRGGRLGAGRRESEWRPNDEE
jgi:hypothetical protein